MREYRIKLPGKAVFLNKYKETGASHYEAAPLLYKKRHSGCTNLNAGGKM